MKDTQRDPLKFDHVPAHDAVAHKGLALSQTGYRKGCFRCKWLKRMERRGRKRFGYAQVPTRTNP